MNRLIKIVHVDAVGEPLTTVVEVAPDSTIAIVGVGRMASGSPDPGGVRHAFSFEEIRTLELLESEA